MQMEEMARSKEYRGENGGAANELGNTVARHQSLPASGGEGTQRVPHKVLTKDSINQKSFSMNLIIK